MKTGLLQVAVLLFVVLSTLDCHPVLAANFGCQVGIDPEQPTELDEVEVSVSFCFRTHPPHVVDFGLVNQNGNVLSVNVIVLVPRKDEFVLQVAHTDGFTYHLGRLEAGNYIFEVYVETIHGNEQFWVEKKVDFNVAPSETTVPEFPSNIGLLLILVLTAIIILLTKKFVKA